jgi:hypothetical protein
MLDVREPTWTAKRVNQFNTRDRQDAIDALARFVDSQGYDQQARRALRSKQTLDKSAVLISDYLPCFPCTLAALSQHVGARFVVPLLARPMVDRSATIEVSGCLASPMS